MPMTPSQEALSKALREIMLGESSLWTTPGMTLARQAMRRCMDHMGCRDEVCVPEVLNELQTASDALLGKAGAGTAMQSIRRAITHLRTIHNNAPLERGA